MSEAEMKSEATVRNYISELQGIVNRDDVREDDFSLEGRIAYFGVNLLRRVTEDVEWETITEDLQETASLIAREMDEGRY